MGVLIDTGVFASWEREGGIVDFFRWSPLGEPSISVVTQSELMVGVYRSKLTINRERRLRFVQAIISHVAVLPINVLTADYHAQIMPSLSDLGTPIGPHDNWIAATAIAKGYTISLLQLLKETCRNFLTEESSMPTIDPASFERYMFHFANSLSPDAAVAFANSRPDAEFQQRLDWLAERSSTGVLSESERAEYESHVHTMDFMALLRARARPEG